jgi:Tfp pilus assembly protein PilX
MRTSQQFRRAERGSALVIGLILLAVITLFGVGAISSGLVNLRIARNTQLAAEAQMAAQRVIDTKISALTTFTAPAASVSTVDATGGSTTYSVAFALPDCVFIRAAPGYSYDVNLQAPKDTTWRLVATATDTGSGTSVQVLQGVKVRLPTNATCP